MLLLAPWQLKGTQFAYGREGIDFQWICAIRDNPKNSETGLVAVIVSRKIPQ
jgi:hypothetical protein